MKSSILALASGASGRHARHFYVVMGEVDLSEFREAPDDAAITRHVLSVGGLRFVRTKTLKAFPETVYREIIRSLG
jgi:uncharacterized protein with GYD domain